jgi:hypothetical protein
MSPEPIEAASEAQTDISKVGALVRRNFQAQCDFLAELVKVASDNPPGDTAPMPKRPLLCWKVSGLSSSATMFLWTL